MSNDIGDVYTRDHRVTVLAHILLPKWEREWCGDVYRNRIEPVIERVAELPESPLKAEMLAMLNTQLSLIADVPEAA